MLLLKKCINVILSITACYLLRWLIICLYLSSFRTTAIILWRGWRILLHCFRFSSGNFLWRFWSCLICCFTFGSWFCWFSYFWFTFYIFICWVIRSWGCFNCLENIWIPKTFLHLSIKISELSISISLSLEKVAKIPWILHNHSAITTQLRINKEPFFQLIWCLLSPEPIRFSIFDLSIVHVL